MTTAWPGTIPTAALITDSSYNESGDTNVAENKPQVGPPLRRRRSSVPSKMITFSQILTFAQWDLLQTFYDTTLFDGTDYFTRPHPRTLSTITCTFVDRPVSGPPISATQYQIRMNVRVYG